MRKHEVRRSVNSAGISYGLQSGIRNPGYREDWLGLKLRQLSTLSGSCLDVGAGTGPYRPLVQELGFHYFAHDFAEYVPSSAASGLQNPDWKLTPLDFVCDILEIPEEPQYSVVLCSEVLEHVPDPTAALAKLSRLVDAGGSLLITVPFLSLMHQAPHWHASGLSPFFFHHWIPKLGLKIDEITVHGDYVDLMTQELGRTIAAVSSGILGKVLARVMRSALRRARTSISDDLLTAGGFGVTVRASSPVR